MVPNISAERLKMAEENHVEQSCEKEINSSSWKQKN